MSNNCDTKVTAVTIGIGEPYFSYAEKACKEINKLLNLETKIITEEYLNYCVGDHKQERIWSLKYSIFDIFPDIDTVMYFDVDWRPIKSFNILDYCPDKNKIYFTQDDSDSCFIQDLEKKYGLEPRTYVNAGWFVINRKNKDLLTYCRDHFYTFDRSFYGDQCVINQVFKNKTTIVDRKLNYKDVSDPLYGETLGLHNKNLNWDFYEKNL
jgi:lipopolysaccharide biosynthesis glycosyltransferase